MRCPKCQFDHPLQTTECLKCGIVFSRYQPALESAANQAHPDATIAVSAAVSAPAALPGLLLLLTTPLTEAMPEQS